MLYLVILDVIAGEYKILSCQNISKSYAAKTLFTSVSLSLDSKTRLGLIGPNGSGKSTLLKILSGSVEPDSGTVTKEKHLKIAHVTQEFVYPENQHNVSVYDYALMMQDSHDDYSVQVSIALGKAGFENFDMKISELSGGWKKRLSIAVAAASEPNVVFFDEPTNHLDLDGLLWLENYMRTTQFAWICISHDRYFLNQTCKNVMELNRVFVGGYFISPGNYNDFLKSKEEFIDGELKKSDTLRNKLRKEEDWLSRQPKARTTKSKSRIDEAYDMKDQLHQLNQRLNKSKLYLNFSDSKRKSKKLMSIEKISKAFGDNVILKDFSIDISNHMRLGILGKNGEGKSTFLKIVAGEIPIDSGRIKPLDDLKIVYFDQARDKINPEWSLKRALCEDGDQVIYRGKPVHVFSWAKRFQFDPLQLDDPFKNLSGGEKARVIISRLMQQSADLLILDEPTNDLDIETLEVLEESIQEFSGAVLLVTHDRFMMSTLCHSYLDIKSQSRMNRYSDWEAKSNKAVSSKEKSGKKPKNAAKKLSYKEQKEYNSLEAKILSKEEKVEILKNELNDPALAADASKLTQLSEKLDSETAHLEKYYSRWAELEEKLKPRES